MQKGGYIYILTNKNNTVLYVGVTSNLAHRIMQHRTGKFKNAFTNRYNLTKLIYCEKFLSIDEAIAREKQLKAGSRKKKIDLIVKRNPEWKELYKDTFDFIEQRQKSDEKKAGEFNVGFFVAVRGCFRKLHSTTGQKV